MFKIIAIVVLFTSLQLAQAKVNQEEQESFAHYAVKVGFWFFLGISIGVYFQARLNLKEIMRPFIDIILYGLLIGITVYTLFSFGQFIENLF